MLFRSEVVVLRQIIESGVPARIAVDNWQGPMDGLHDFVIGSGAIEVKTTVSATGFPATLSSLDQLDESLRQPLFVAAVRLRSNATATTLSQLIKIFRTLLEGEQVTGSHFETKLVRAGYLEATSEKYSRKFEPSKLTVLPVIGTFPRLTRTNVSAGIKEARYQVDLDHTGVHDIGLAAALQQLGES